MIKAYDWKFTSSSVNWNPSIPISTPESWHGVFVGMFQAARSC